MNFAEDHRITSALRSYTIPHLSLSLVSVSVRKPAFEEITQNNILDTVCISVAGMDAL